MSEKSSANYVPWILGAAALGGVGLVGVKMMNDADVAAAQREEAAAQRDREFQLRLAQMQQQSQQQANNNGGSNSGNKSDPLGDLVGGAIKGLGKLFGW